MGSGEWLSRVLEQLTFSEHAIKVSVCIPVALGARRSYFSLEKQVEQNAMAACHAENPHFISTVGPNTCEGQVVITSRDLKMRLKRRLLLAVCERHPVLLYLVSLPEELLS